MNTIILDGTENEPQLRRLSGYFRSLLLTESQQQATITEQHRAILVNAFSIACLILIAAFAVEPGESLLHRLIQGAVFLFTAANLVWSRRGASIRAAGRNVVIVIGVMATYLVITGGEANTGPLWVLAYPAVVFYLQGYRRGGAVVAGTALLYALILFLPDGMLLLTTYGAAFKLRFFFAFIMSAGVALIYEYSRERAENDLLDTAEKLDRYARTDPLTGLSNRRDMLDQLSKEHYRYERSGHSYAVLVCDVDHFKSVNDSFGHEAGDAVLVQIAALLRDSLKHQDYIARWGGEEFLILLTDTTEAQAGHAAERLRCTVENRTFESASSGAVTVTVSFGYAAIEDALSVEQLIHRADLGLYHAKSAGRNRVSHSTDAN